MMFKKIFLYATSFFCGMSVMAIELGAQRMLAPYFSSSQIIWTIVIGMIMISMAVGNILGGRIADKSEKPDKLFLFMFLAAIWVCLIPLLGKFIIAGIAVGLALVITENYLIWASVISCLIVFIAPLLVLGMVTPNLVRFACTDFDNKGRTVGIIEACATIGSILGTFLPTFVTIPFVGTAFTFLIFGIILFVISVTYFIICRKKYIGKIVVAVISIALGICSCFIGVAFWDNAVIEEDESIYNYLRVEKERNKYILSTNVMFGVQSISIEGDGLTGMYYDKALVAPVAAMDGSPLDICILGLGTGTFATQCLRYFDCGNIDGVEIDEKIVNLAYEYFDLSDKVNAVVDDGRSFITYTDKTYDVIMVDAYRDITIPFQMSSIEFFRQVYDHLNDNGIMVVNFNMDTISEDSINDYLASTINNVFDRVYLLKSNSNVELFACKNDNFLERFHENIGKLKSSKLRNYMLDFYDNLYEYTRDDLILTDDKAPVEMLGIKVLDEMIMDEIPEVKKLLKENSLKDLWKMLVNGEL